MKTKYSLLKFVFELLDILFNLRLMTFSVFVTSSFRISERTWIEKGLWTSVEKCRVIVFEELKKTTKILNQSEHLPP